MTSPRLCDTCKGIRTVHGVIAGSRDCPECLAYYQEDVTSSRKKLATRISAAIPLDANGNGVDFVSQVSPHDVLLGRGKFANNRQGNQYYRSLLEAHCDGYAKCTTQSSKTEFTMAIVHKIRRVGRFLKPVRDYEGAFVEIPNTKARVKVGQDLRYQQLQKEKRRSIAKCETKKKNDPTESHSSSLAHSAWATGKRSKDVIKNQEGYMGMSYKGSSQGCIANTASNLLTKMQTAQRQSKEECGNQYANRVMDNIAKPRTDGDVNDSTSGFNKGLALLNRKYSYDKEEPSYDQFAVSSPSELERRLRDMVARDLESMGHL